MDDEEPKKRGTKAVGVDKLPQCLGEDNQKGPQHIPLTSASGAKKKKKPKFRATKGKPKKAVK
jgi:hypothetical protein